MTHKNVLYKVKREVESTVWERSSTLQNAIRSDRIPHHSLKYLSSGNDTIAPAEVRFTAKSLLLCA